MEQHEANDMVADIYIYIYIYNIWKYIFVLFIFCSQLVPTLGHSQEKKICEIKEVFY